MAVPDWQGYWEEEWGKCVEEGRRINEEPIPPENFSAVDFTTSQCPDCGESLKVVEPTVQEEDPEAKAKERKRNLLCCVFCLPCFAIETMFFYDKIKENKTDFPHYKVCPSCKRIIDKDIRFVIKEKEKTSQADTSAVDTSQED